MSVFGLHIPLNRSRCYLEKVLDELLSSTAYALFTSLAKRQIRRAAVATVPSHQKRQGVAPGDGMSRQPVLALVALMLNPKILWL